MLACVSCQQPPFLSRHSLVSRSANIKSRKNYKGKEINALPNEMSWLSVQTKKLVKDNNLQLDKFAVQ